MAYTRFREGLYRTGYRPVGATNPFAAASGNGISVDEAVLSGLGRTPFDPEVLRETLRGMGQHELFPPGGGYGLHGLGDIVPNGSVVTYQGQWSANLAGHPSASPGSIIAAVAQALSRDGLSVINSSSSGAFWGALVGDAWTVTLQIQVSNGMGYGQPSDIGSIVDHEAFLATGVMPAGSAVSVQSIPGSTPGLPATATDLTTWLEQNALWIGLGIVGIVAARRLL